MSIACSESRRSKVEGVLRSLRCSDFILGLTSFGRLHTHSRSRRWHLPQIGVTPSHFTLLSAQPRHALVVRGFLYRELPSDERCRLGLDPGGVGGGCLVSICLTVSQSNRN